MRKLIIAAVSCAAVSMAMPALAQGRGGPPAGVGGGIGAGPPITPPGQMGGSRATADYARDSVAASRGQVGREFAELRRMNAQDRAATYRQMTEQHRLNALQIAQMARAGSLPANSGGQIRDALKADLSAWREAFQVGRRNWQAMRDQWIVDRDSLTPEQWAFQRANWFAARDAWISQQTSWAQAQGQ